ncbi:MAG: LuxR family transcriptional regulator [Microbacteriaceae bacterium]|nr:LuxR family transcriptional regulator [Microbacteriaceae bacterium]
MTLTYPGPIDLLDGVHRVLASPLLEVAPAFSRALGPLLGHSALLIFTEDCTGRPTKTAGDRTIVDRVTLAELDAIRAGFAEHTTWLADASALIAGRQHPFVAWMASTGALLVLTDPSRRAADGAMDEVLTLVGRLWQLVAQGIRHQVAAATPAYLADSRAASVERARTIAELTDAHSTTLESLLAVLRSRATGDSAARQSAVDIAANAMVQLRAVSDRDRLISEEPVATAFERLRDDLRPLVRFGDLDMQFVEPPVNGRALPGEVAHAGRAIVRGAVLALIDQADVSRIRVQWDCDGRNLLINIRDDGPGGLTPQVASVRQLAARVDALDGTLRVNATSGWGSEIAVLLPLDAPTAAPAASAEWGLSKREYEVLGLVVAGARNRAVAQSLSISENTVKFHVANLLRKVGATTRGELAALVR